MVRFVPRILRAPLDPMRGGGGGGYIDNVSRIKKHLEQLSRWANANQRDAKFDFIRFWIFKLPAIFSSVLTAAAASIGLKESFIAILAAVAAILVAIDGFWPGGFLHNVHKRALHDIRLLNTNAETELDKVLIKYPEASPERAKEILLILELITTERNRIAKYIAEAESSLGIKRKVK